MSAYSAYPIAQRVTSGSILFRTVESNTATLNVWPTLGTCNTMIMTGNKVGIRTDTPTCELDVRGNLNVISSVDPVSDTIYAATASNYEYPPSAMVSASHALYSSYVSGTFNATASSSSSATLVAYTAFNKVVNVSTAWVTSNAAGYLYNTTTGAYAGNSSLGGISGEWLKIEFPGAMYLRYYTIFPRTTSILINSPKTFNIIASNDDVNWTVVDTETAVDWVAGDSVTGQTFTTTPPTTAYRFYAIVVTVTGNTGQIGRTQTAIAEWKLYGQPDCYSVIKATSTYLQTKAIGIGTVPTANTALDAGRVRIFNDNTYGVISLARGADTGHNFFIEGVGTTTSLRIRNSTGANGGNAIVLADSVIQFMNNTSSTERMRVDTSGNVGIGTTIPLKIFHVNGASYFSSNVQLGTDTVTLSSLTGNRVIGLNSVNNLVSTSTPLTTLSYINNVTSDIQTQLNRRPTSITRLVSNFTNASTAVSTVTSFTMNANMTVSFVFQCIWGVSAVIVPQIQIANTAGTAVFLKGRTLTYQSDSSTIERVITGFATNAVMSTSSISATGEYLLNLYAWVQNTSGAPATIAIRAKSDSATSTLTIPYGTLNVYRDTGETTLY